MAVENSSFLPKSLAAPRARVTVHQNVHQNVHQSPSDGLSRIRLDSVSRRGKMSLNTGVIERFRPPPPTNPLIYMGFLRERVKISPQSSPNWQPVQNLEPARSLLAHCSLTQQSPAASAPMANVVEAFEGFPPHESVNSPYPGNRPSLHRKRCVRKCVGKSWRKH